MKKHSHRHHSRFRNHLIRNILFIIGGFFLFIVGIGLIWISSLKLPNLDAFEQRKVASSTKIYDRTGEIILFDVHKDVKRTIIPAENISTYAKNAAVAIEDDEFYQHNGIDIRAIIRAVWANVRNVDFGQGGSTITQQVVKNTLLVNDKRISRKLKEWFLAVKLEQKLTKDEILAQYLNVVPYGGTIYGIEQASQSFFAKTAADITLAEAAYLAALPNAPTFYSPYGQNVDRLENRKNTVLKKMIELGFINEEEFEEAKNEEVEFRPREESFAKALHFVEYVRAQLEERYGRDAIENDGLKVITTLDYDLQKQAEEIVYENALINEENWNASNQGAIVIDPKTGQILSMIGSRDYFDSEIDGNFNITLAERQPGSAFKPFAYLTAFAEGYTPETIVFDTRTQFTPSCGPYDMSSEQPCYSPQNYDGLYNGPTTLRAGLAESRNVPSVKTLYLVGIRDALRTAKDLGISTLSDADQYGLTLVLGGGEVQLLEMTSAYSVLANGGIRNNPTGILRIEDKEGNILEEFNPRPQRVADAQAVALLNDVLSDNQARLPLFNTPNNYLYFGENRDVAGKTGTTNNNRDAWLIGYSPDVAVGIWTGNNDNTPMTRGSAISGKSFREIMSVALQGTPNSRFEEPATIENYENLNPMLRGEWKGGEVISIDSISGKLASEYTPEETREEIPLIEPHNILHWVDKNDPQGLIPNQPEKDSQYEQWEIPVQNWLQTNTSLIGNQTKIPTTYDDIHIPENFPEIKILDPNNNQRITNPQKELTINVSTDGEFTIEKVNYFLNDVFIGSSNKGSFSFSFIPADINGLRSANTLKAIVYDEVFNSSEDSIEIIVN
jgi:1A family penicillin-binding protein